MASTQLRRVTSTRLDDIVRQLNALIDRDLGNSTGRINLIGDGGLVKDLQGGTVTASAIPVIQAFPASGQQMWLKHSSGGVALRVQDSGVSTGIPFSGTTGAFSGNVTVTGTLGVTGTLTATGNTVLGDAAGDTVTISGPVTGTTANFTTSVSAGGGTYPASGVYRMAQNTYIYSVGSTGDVQVMGMSSADNLIIGQATKIDRLETYAQNGIRLYVGANIRYAANTAGVAFNGSTPAAPPNATVTNLIVNRSIDPSTINHATLAYVVATLVQDVIDWGLYS